MCFFSCLWPTSSNRYTVPVLQCREACSDETYLSVVFCSILSANSTLGQSRRGLLVSENLVAIPRSLLRLLASRAPSFSLCLSLREPPAGATALHAHYGPGRDVSCQSSNESRLISRAPRCRSAEAPPPSFAALDESFQARP